MNDLDFPKYSSAPTTAAARRTRPALRRRGAAAALTALALAIATSALTNPALAQGSGNRPAASPAAAAPANAGNAAGTSGAANPAMASQLCGLLKQTNAKAVGKDAASVQMDLVMSMGRSVQYDPDKIKTMKAEFDKVTSASCPIDRELMLSTLKAKSLTQALK